MNAKQAKELLPYTIVMRNKNPQDIGTVCATTPHSFYVDWENGKLEWIANGDAKQVDLYDPSPVKSTK